MILRTVKETIVKYGLFEKGDKILLAYSGGVDSTGLLGVFLDLQQVWSLDLFLGHFNHRLRSSAMEEEQFVRRIAQEKGIPLYVASEDVRSLAKKRKLNLEEAGRMLRYDFLVQTAKKIGGAKIATGHTMNDQAETFLLRMMRGSGLKGLGSIYPSVEGTIIRPLLFVERKDIEEYLREKGMEFRRDESNLDRGFTRNKIRLDLIPFIQKNFAPKIIPQISKIVSILQEEDALMEKSAVHEARKAVFLRQGEIHLDLQTTRALPRALGRRVVRHFLKRIKGDLRAISFEDVESIMDLAEGESIQLKKELLFKRANGLVSRRVVRPAKAAYEYLWDGSSPLKICGPSLLIMAERRKNPSLPGAFDDSSHAFLDGAKVHFPLTVRNRREGDKYRPLGAPGKKKLKEVMRAKGVPLRERDRRPVFLSGEEIVWIVGLPVAEKFKVGRSTKEIVVLTVSVNEAQR
jgi:tRNA(Ile)-lysidine synthase